MPAGMRVWEKATNTVAYDTSTSITMPLGYLTIGGDGAPASGSISVPEFSLGVPDFSILIVAVGPNTTYKFIGQSPTISISGTTLSWQFNSARGPNYPTVKVFYGLI